MSLDYRPQKEGREGGREGYWQLNMSVRGDTGGGGPGHA